MQKGGESSLSLSLSRSPSGYCVYEIREWVFYYSDFLAHIVRLPLAFEMKTERKKFKL